MPKMVGSRVSWLTQSKDEIKLKADSRLIDYSTVIKLTKKYTGIYFSTYSDEKHTWIAM